MLQPDPKKLRYLGIPMHARATRRTVTVLYFAIYIVAIDAWSYNLESHKLVLNLVSFAALASVLTLLGPFRKGGPVRDPEPDRSYLKDRVMLKSLDDWARHFYGAPLDQLTPEDQSDILRRYRVGNWLFPRNERDGSDLDEREMVEWNVACRDAVRLQSSCLTVVAGIALAEFDSGHIDTRFLLAMLVAAALLGYNLPKAVVFWREPDPTLP